MQFKDNIRLLQDLLSIHSMQGSQEPRAIKDGIVNLCFALVENIQSQLSLDDFKKLIYTNTVYCFTTEKLEKLKKYNNVFLCASKNPNDFNINYGVISNINYKYCYKIILKENTYGIDLNGFFNNEYIIKARDKKYYWNWGAYHHNENEVIIKVKDINFDKTVLI